MATIVKKHVMNMTLNANNIKKVVKTYSMSRRYMHTMLKTSVFNILYHRLPIDEKEFITKIFDKNVNYKSYKNKSRNNIINILQEYMNCCKEALERNYLKEFCLFFLQEGDIVEYYKFSFKYRDNNERAEIHDAAALMEDTSEMLKTLGELRQHPKLQTEIQMKCELHFVDDTPDNYTPSGLERLNTTLKSKLPKNGNVVSLGRLDTGFHVLKCSAKGNAYNIDETALSESDMGILKIKEERNNETDNQLEPLPLPDAESLQNKKTVVTANMNETYRSQYQDIKDDSIEEDPIDCICKLQPIAFYKVDVIKCSKCKKTYHAACQKFLDKSYVKEPFLCTVCRGDDSELLNQVANSRIRFILAILNKHGHLPNEMTKLFPFLVDRMEKGNLIFLQGDYYVLNMEKAQKFFDCTHHTPADY